MNVYCPNCEHSCSESSLKCPRCGHPLKKSRRWAWVVIAACLAVGVAFVLNGKGTTKVSSHAEVGTPEWGGKITDEVIVDVMVALKARELYLASGIREVDDIMEPGFDPTLYVAKEIGALKERWLSLSLKWAIEEFDKGKSFRAYYSDAVFYVFNLTDDARLRAQAATAYLKMCEVDESVERPMGLIVRVLESDGETDTTRLTTVCKDKSEAEDWNKDAERDDDKMVLRQFPEVGACWCDRDVVAVTIFNRAIADAIEKMEK